jgi:hypothetical protein
MANGQGVLAHISGKNAASFHSYLARRQSYARGFPLRFIEGADHISPKVDCVPVFSIFRLLDYESSTLSKKSL